jgi:predicted nucleic acid-binding protein
VALVARYLADKSALARMAQPAVGERLGSLLNRQLIATCPLVDLEVLYSARGGPDYDKTLGRRRALELVEIDQRQADRAIEVQQTLASTGQHRLPIQDLLIAAAAESARLTLLHYDADYERIAEVTGQPHEWVAPRGSID